MTERIVYQQIELVLGLGFLYPLPIFGLFGKDGEWVD